MLPALSAFFFDLLVETLPLLIAALSGHRLLRSTGPNRALYAATFVLAALSGAGLAGVALVPRPLGLAGTALALPLWLFVRHVTRSPAGRYRIRTTRPVFRTKREPLLLSPRLRREAGAG